MGEHFAFVPLGARNGKFKTPVPFTSKRKKAAFMKGYGVVEQSNIHFMAIKAHLLKYVLL